MYIFSLNYFFKLRKRVPILWSAKIVNKLNIHENKSETVFQVLKEENLILDFRKADHDLTNASDIIESFRKLLENYKKHEEFDQLKKDIKDELRKFGQQAYQHDVREAQLHGRNRGNRPVIFDLFRFIQEML